MREIDEVPRVVGKRRFGFTTVGGAELPGGKAGMTVTAMPAVIVVVAVCCWLIIAIDLVRVIAAVGMLAVSCSQDALDTRDEQQDDN